MNINLAIIKGAKVLKDNFINNPYLDSEILMAKVINKDRKYLLINSDRCLEHKDLDTFQKLIKKRSLGKPIAYLTNKKFFWDSEFIVSKDTLIPRPDTELIIEKVLELISNKKKNEYIRNWNWIGMYTTVNFKREKEYLRNRYRY